MADDYMNQLELGLVNGSDLSSLFDASKSILLLSVASGILLVQLTRAFTAWEKKSSLTKEVRSEKEVDWEFGPVWAPRMDDIMGIAAHDKKVAQKVVDYNQHLIEYWEKKEVEFEENR